MRKRTIFRSIAMFSTLILHQIRMMAVLTYGVWRISKFKHAPVTVFGGARLKPESIYMIQAQELAHRLAQAGIPVITGGGPGIMEAANCGAFDKDTKVITTIGITVRGLDTEDTEPRCKRDVIVMENFASRKWLLTQYSIGFAVFPGGFGTLDELTQLLTLIQTHMRPKSPIVLMGVEYWKPFMVWLEESALKNGLVTSEEVALFSITDSVDEAFDKLHIFSKTWPYDIT